MGGTLPVLARRLVGKVEQTRHYVANLYALNSFGAVLGAATAGFITLPLFGVYVSLLIACLLNLCAAALVLGPARREIPLTSPTELEDKQELQQQGSKSPVYYSDLQYRATLVALALSGFAALGYEVLFIRVIALSFGSSTYSFSVMLISFILGISIGSAIIARVAVKNPLWLFGISQFCVVAALLAVTPFVAQLPYLIGLMRIDLTDAQFGFELYQLGKVSLCLVVLLLPTIFLGFSFPLVAQIQARRSSDLGYRIGSTYAWNTTGNVLGATLTGLVLLPQLGTLGAFHFNFLLNLLAGFLVLCVAIETSQKRRLVASALMLLITGGYLVTGTGWLEPITMAHHHLRMKGPPASASLAERARHPTTSFEAWKRRYVADPEKYVASYFEEDAQVTVLALDTGRRVTLNVNGKPDASTGGDMLTQVFLGHLPAFLAPQARSALIIGHGSGITSGSLLRHPIERADIVEISSAVLNADRLFSDYNYAVLDDPRVTVYQDDAQSFLRAVPHRYDIIVSEPSNPWIAGVSGLFTREFFEIMSNKLNPGGVAAVWFHAYEQSDEDLQMVLRTIGSVFPHAFVARSPDYTDILVIASNERIEPDFAAMETRFDQPAVRNDLARIAISNLASLIIHYALTPDSYRQLIPEGPLNTVAHQRLEYSAPRSLFNSSNSFFIRRSDPLLSNPTLWNSTILGRYFKYRAAVGDPVKYSELEYLIYRSPEQSSNAIKRLPLSRPGTQLPTRPARGAVAEVDKAGLHEAAFWHSYFGYKDQPDLAASYLNRYENLRRSMDRN